MWIAKNSITGKFYGEKYESIYDCQSFIDKKLFLLEYEMQRCFSLEKDVVANLKKRSIFEIMQDAFRDFENDSGIKDDIHAICEMTLSGRSQKEIDIEIHRLAMCRWQKNNIIRCYNTEQQRFADGFDF